ncbi:MAG: molybdenum cofactor guanylyltransferase [Vicinamibacterales bacterium]
MYDSSTTSAAIVAGGSARRFAGQDKSRLLVEGRSIIVRQVALLQRVAHEVLILAADASRYSDIGLAVHPDRLPGLGAIGGIYTALCVAAGPRVLTIACDLPFLETGLLQALAERSEGFDGAWVRTGRGPEPLLACYRTSARDRVRGQIEADQLKAADLGTVLQMAEIDEAHLAEFGDVDRLLANINTPEDYARVQYRRS